MGSLMRCLARNWRGRGTAFSTAALQLPCTPLAFWGKGHTEAWLLLTDLAPHVSDASWNGMRGWIEQFFKGRQTRGLAMAAHAHDRPQACGAAAARDCGGDAPVIALSGLDNLMYRRPPPRECGVEVTGFLPPARGWLAGLVRTLRGVGQEEAEKMLGQLPLRLADGLTHGQAEDLLAQLARERAVGRLAKATDTAAASP